MRLPTTGPAPVLDGHSRALFEAIDAHPRAPVAVGIQGPGGYGKSATLQELALVYRRAGVTVRTELPDAPERVDEDCALLIDDAHLLDEARLRVLCRLVESRRHRLAVAYRPWPRPSTMVELAESLKRDGSTLLLCPFTEEQTATYLAGVYGTEVPAALVRYVHAQTAGVPRFVDRLARALPPDSEPPAEAPRSAVLRFGSELDDLDDGVRRLLLAVATGVRLPLPVLTALLSADADGVDETVKAARATGLLGPDDRLPPLMRHAVVSLIPAPHRIAVWQRLAELQMQRGAPVLPLVRTLLGAGANGESLAVVFEAAGSEALVDEPALAAEIFATAAAAGRPTTARHALAAALSGDLDSALRLSDRLIAAPGSPERADGAAVAATALTHRGQAARGAELYRWAGTASSAAFAAIGYLGTGHPEEADRLLPHAPPSDGPPTLLASAALLMARGVRETIAGSSSAALSALVQASALLEPSGRAALLPDSPAALAALVALHCGEFDIAERVLDRAVAARMGGALMARRHRLLQAWILLVRGRTAAAAQSLAAVTAAGAPLESRDLLFATALEMGVARRDSDLAALARGWAHAREAVVRHPVDLFTLLPLGEFAIAAARLGELATLLPYLQDARLLLERLGNPALWETPLHWSALHAAITAERPAAADDHVRILAGLAEHSRYGAVLAAAAQAWVEVLRGVVDPEKVEAAARGLYDAGLCWDGARLAGQAAIRTADRRAMTALLDCARALQGRSAGPRSAGRPPGSPATGVAEAVAAPSEGRLSDREQEVADLVLAGMTYKQIGDRLFISAKTVEHHVARMRQRLGCGSRSELLARLRAMAAQRSAGAPVGVPWPRLPSP